MILEVDDDGSGQIEFAEFLGIINNSAADASEGVAGVNQFFKDMVNGTLGSKDLSFNIIVQNIRRKYMIDAILGKGRQKDKGL